MSANSHVLRSFMQTSSNRWRYFVFTGFILSGFYLLCFSNLDLSYYFSSAHYHPWQNSVQNIPKVKNHKIEEPGSNMVIVRDLETTAANFGGRSTFPKPIIQETGENVTHPVRTFSKLLEEFDWRSYDADIKNNNHTNQKIWVENFIHKMSYFLALPPIVPKNPNCTAPALPPPEEINCSTYPNGFTGIRNIGTVKIGVLIKFGFDVDILEIHLNEVYEVVDQFFIIESTKIHQKILPKPLVWEEVKHQERFIKFAPKITHFIIDDAQNADAFVKTNSDPTSIWLMENLEERLRWEKFLEWNNARSFFSADDIIGFEDADEVPSRRMVNMLKYCEIKGGNLDIGIWFPFGNIKEAFRTDFPVRGYPYTFAGPAFWKFKSARDVYESKSKREIPFKTRGKAHGFLLGGMHMTHYGYLPFQFLKRISNSEETSLLIGDAGKMYKNITVDGIRVMELEYGAVPEMHKHGIVSLTTISQEMKDIAILPWFYDCNRDRYPVWEGRRDSRLY